MRKYYQMGRNPKVDGASGGTHIQDYLLMHYEASI